MWREIYDVATIVILGFYVYVLVQALRHRPGSQISAAAEAEEPAANPTDIALIASGLFDLEDRGFEDDDRVEKTVATAIRLYREAERQLATESSTSDESGEDSAA